MGLYPQKFVIGTHLTAKNEFLFNLIFLGGEMELNIMMPKGIGTFTKGIATGMIMGAAVSMISKPMGNHKRSNLKKNASKTLRAVGDLIQNAQYMMK
jgi:hypothetical protein